jgi:hypothetical protein
MRHPSLLALPLVALMSAAAGPVIAQQSAPPAPAAAPSSSTPRPATATRRAPGAAPAAAPATTDRATIDRAQIIGNRELPKVLYIVPWRAPDAAMPDLRPPNSVLDEALAPIDRDVFRRQLRFDAATQARAAIPPPAPYVYPSPVPVLP